MYKKGERSRYLEEEDKSQPTGSLFLVPMGSSGKGSIFARRAGMRVQTAYKETGVIR